MSANWPGVIEPKPFNKSHVDNINKLADAAKAGEWDEVFGLIDSDHWLSPHQWRISGTSWFAPLHQAAWLGASPDVVDELIRRGAWRSLRSASSDRAVDCARDCLH